MKRLLEVLGTTAYSSVFGVFGINLMNTIEHISKANTMKLLMIVFSYSKNLNTIATTGIRGRNAYVNQ
jgi:hypothetical protein